MASKKIKKVIAVSLNNFLDSGCIVAGASGLALWAKAFHMSSFLVGLLGALSANAVGAAIGALIGGYLTDRFGRKLIYTYNMLLYMLGCLIVILAFNPIMLFIGFITLGISVGAGVPASWSYISETSDSKNRGSNIGLSQLFWALGPTFVFIVATITSPLGLLGNRIVFLMLLIVAFVAWLLQRQLQESQAWQDDNKGQAIKHNSYRELLTNKINLKNILFLVSVYLFWNLVASSSGFFMPFVYSSVGHISYSYTQVISAIAGIVNALAAYFIFTMFVDKTSHRLMFFISAIGSVISWISLTFFGFNQLGLWTYVILWNGCGAFGPQAFYALWSTELFQTRYRGAAQGLMFFLVRASSGVMSIAFPIIIASIGFQFAGYMMIFFLTISLVVGTIWTPKTRGKDLTEISAEVYQEKQN